MLEHIHVDKVRRLLTEIFESLNLEGFQSDCTDLEIHAKNYAAGNDAYFAPIIKKYMSRWEQKKDKYWLVRSNGSVMTRAATL